MSDSHSTPPGLRNKPAKPRPDFPLFPHATGRWAKKIRGKLHYFGPWSDPEGALQKYREQAEALHAGRTPRPDAGALTVNDAANHFLAAKQARVDTGELARRSWQDYEEACVLLAKHFGRQRLVADLGPSDFEKLRAKLAKRWGPSRLGVVIQKIRSVFKYALAADLIDRPVRFGPGFVGPSAKTRRLHRAGRGLMMFEAAEIRTMLAAAKPTLKAMILLGANCGFGNTDVGRLPVSALDLEGGWVNYPRPKTGVARRAALWPETVAALKEALAARPDPKDSKAGALVFLRLHGKTLAPDIHDTPLSGIMRAFLNKLGINGARNFYALRHTFETIAGESKDQVAVNAIMGHTDDSMAAAYRERISDARLQAVAEHVRGWLFGPAARVGTGASS
jgi:integrase